MKNILFSLLFLTFNFLLSQDNFNYFIYKVYQNNIDLQSNKKLEGLISKSNDSILYELKLNYPKANFEAIDVLDNSQERSLNFNKVFINSQGKFYYDENEKIVENQKIALGKTFIIKNDFKNFNWDVKDEYETINNLVCRKAILIKNEKDSRGNDKKYIITVWYDETFPQNISPFGLVGLKGLIVKIDFNGNYESVLADYKYIKIDKPILPFKTGKNITEAELQDLLINYMIKRREQALGVDKD